MRIALPPPEPLLIKRGDAHTMHAKPGTTLLCCEGSLLVMPAPACPYETVHQLRTTLQAGEAYLVDRHGPVSVSALRDCRLQCIAPPASATQRLLASAAHALGQLLHGRPARALRRAP